MAAAPLDVVNKSEIAEELAPRGTDLDSHHHADIVIGLRSVFDVHDVPMDSDCFFTCAVRHLSAGSMTTDSLKGIIASYAMRNWAELKEAATYYPSPEEYVSDLRSRGFWGGSAEAEILNKAFGLPIIFWQTEDFVTTQSARFWTRRHGNDPEMNLAANGRHFQYLTLKGRPRPPPRELVIEDDGLEVVSESDADEVQNLEDIFLPQHEKMRLELFSKQPEPRPQTGEIDRQLLRLLDQEKTLPLRIGRLLSKIFPCNVKAQRLDTGDYILLPEHSAARGLIGLSELGWSWMKVRAKKQMSPTYNIMISEELLAYSDSQFVLGNLAGHSLLASNAAILPTEVVYKVASVAAIVLMSSFIYKSPMKVKRKFIEDNLRLNGVSPSPAKRFIMNLRPFSVYQQPLETAQEMVFLCLGRMCEDVSLRVSRLPATSYLLLNCVDVAERSIKEYINLLDALEGEDISESTISSSEVYDILTTCVRLEALFDLKKNNATKAQYLDYLATQGFDVGKTIHGTSNLYYKAKESVLRKFFESRQIMKLISKHGKAYAGTSISSLMAYISNLLIIREKLGLSLEDIAALETIERRLMAIQSRDKRVPIPILCNLVEPCMEELYQNLPEDCAQECRMLFTRVRNSDTHSTAWSAALRLKGVAYEGLFSKAHNIKYVPEDQKPTLSMAIQTYFPEKFERFLQRTQLHPEVREFRPDFLLAKRTVMPVAEMVFSSIEVVQMINEVPSEDGAHYVKREGRAFPLPEVPISEMHSFREIAPSIELVSKARLERYNMVTGKIMTTEQPKTLKQLSKDAVDKLPENGGSPVADIITDASQSKTEFLIIEVGYQTDTEVKVQMDIDKWKVAISLLKDLGIRSTIVACSDNTGTKASDWYIPERLVKVIKNSVSNLFAKLSQNSPQEVTDIMVGAISTQKLRSVLKSGSTIRTPVTLQDILTTWNENKQYIVYRPTGAVLPSKLEKVMATSLCEGAVITKESARKVTDEVLSQKDVIADWVESTKYKVECLKSVESGEKLMLGWLLDDLSGARCTQCVDKIKQTLKATDSTSEALVYIASQLQLCSHEPCCHKEAVKVRVTDLFRKRITPLTFVSHMSTEISDLEGRTTTLDRLCRLTLPGKTEKERSIKRGVESLMRQTMKDSGIPCIKLPTGQIIVNTELFNSGKARFKRSPRKRDKLEATEDDTDQDSRLSRLKKILSPDRLKGYSEFVQKTIADLLGSTSKQQGSLCCMEPEWVTKVLADLEADSTEEEHLCRIEDTRTKRQNFSINNDKFIPITNEELTQYIADKSQALLNLKNSKLPFKLDCMLHKEIYLECVRRYQNTPYFDCITLIAKLIKLFLSFEWFQELVLYSKICETFLQCCTEFNRSGIKVKRVRHCNLNLAIALPSNKKENMRCSLYDNSFCSLSSKFFLLSRRVAVLGAAIPYIVLICSLQCLQHARCVDVVHGEDPDLIRCVLERNASCLDVLQPCLKEVNGGNFESASRRYVDYCKQSGNFLTRSSRDVFVTTVSGISITFALLLGPAMLLNSQPFNKQIQNMRFGMLYGLSRIASPKELGKKLSSSCRSIEAYIARLTQQLVVFSCGLNINDNIEAWKRHDLCPDVTLPSLTIAGTIVSGDRQLIFDIYLVHIYNKEMDNFDEGCIKVLQETLERHMSWEMQLLESVQKFKDGRITDKLKEFRTMRLLLGLPNLKFGRSEDEGSNKGSDCSSASSVTSSHSIGKTRSFSSGKKIKSVYGRLRSTMKPIITHAGLEVVPDEMSDYRYSAQDTGLGYRYDAKPESVLKDLKQVIKDNPSHTYGSFELVQAMTEVARTKFPPEAVGKAQRDITNWQGVSAYTETTSSISEPRTKIVLKDAIKVLSTGEVKKTVKLIRNRLKKLDGSSLPKPERLSELTNMLCTVETFTEHQLEEIRKGISAPSKLSFFPWREIITRSLRDVLITNDANMLYCWLKSLASGIKKHLKPYMPGLRYSKESKFSDHPKLSKLLGVEALSALGDLTKLFGCLINGHLESLPPIPPKEYLYEAWITFIKAVKFIPEIVEDGYKAIRNCYTHFEELSREFQKLKAIKKEYPDLSFIREEIEVKNLESSFLKEHDHDLMQVINMIFALSLCCPWSIHYKSFELLLSQGSAPLSEDQPQEEYMELLRSLGPCDLIITKCSELFEGEAIGPEEEDTFEMLYRYCCAMFTSNDEPITAVLNISEVPVTSHIEESALSTTRSLLAKYGLDRTDLDFKWTLNLIANSNFEVTKRLTGRTEGERLPRSVRSKVIYEMIKIVKSTGMAILQQHAFSYILNSGHRLFAVLAPKAQLGGHRDLLVQEIMTKIIHAATETFSRALLATTNDDGLTNQHLKESILQSAFESMQLSHHSHGKMVSETGHGLRFFSRTFCISGDRTKWGPIHCTAFFSGMMQQLLQDAPDWSAFFKLVMLKNLYRQVEIPAGAIKKLLNSFRYRLRTQVPVEQLTEDQLRHLMSESTDIWEDNPMMQFLVQVYLSKGKMALECYNHMGQGIHHATSSVMTSCMAVLTEEVIIAYFQSHMPELSTSVKHAGSSDDYAKVVTVSGNLPSSLFERYEAKFWHHVSRLQNSMIGIARGCQMKDSAKTLIGDVLCEFYSEFMIFHRVTPAVIKFILTGLINSSVTSPQSMVQACQVSAQQAMYNSVPLLTDICFTVFRQQMFANHTELFQRKYGPLVHGLPSAFGRLYLPMYSNLTSSSIAVEDAESIAQDLESLIDLSTYLPVLEDPVYQVELPAPKSDDLSTGSSPSLGGNDSEETGSVSSGSTSSFRFSELRRLTVTETEYLKASSLSETKESEIDVMEQVQEMYRHHSDYDGWPCLEKLRNSLIIDKRQELLEVLESNPVRLFRYIRSVITTVIIGYYRSFASEGTEKTLKANLNRDENRIVEDPMIQLLPEKLRRELNRLGLAREEYEGYQIKSMGSKPLAEQIARRLITMNCLTEDYQAEADRLKQTLSSRNIIHGLAGGIKELSLPLYTIFLKSYFFVDKVFLDHSDRWNTKHSRNYRDSSGRPLDGKVVTKYMVWLDAILSSSLTRNMEKTAEPLSLFNKNIKCVGLVVFDDKTKCLDIKVNDLKVFREELRALSIQFSDNNRLKLKVLESSRPLYEREANKVVISKSGLFSAGEQVKIRNNPALVIGFHLSREAVLDVKPSKMDLGSLIHDTLKLEQFYTSISEVCTRIIHESRRLEEQRELPTSEEVSDYANTLTLLSRMAQKSNARIISFHMIKPISTHTESTVSDLISYGTKEGRNLVLAESCIETGTTSLKYWRVMHCLGAIGSLNLSDSSKTDLLVGFMNWVPRLEDGPRPCPMYKHEDTVLEQFKDRSIVSNLFEELPNIKRENERKQIENLVDFVKDPMVLVAKKPFFGKTVDFNTRGSEGARTGSFTMSSSAGEAMGVFVAGHLHVYLSKESDILLTEVEGHVLVWQNRLRTDVVTKEQHDYFIEMLPSHSMLPRRMSEGTLKAVEIDKANPRMLRLTNCRGACKVVRIRPHILTVRKTPSEARLNEPRLVWGKSSISIIYDEVATEATYHESILSLRRKLDVAIESTNVKPPSQFYSDMKIVLGRVHFKQEATNTSLALLHYYLVHSAENVHIEFHTKSALLQRLLGQEQQELNILRRLRDADAVSPKPVVDRTEQLLTIASQIEEMLNKESLPLHCLSEVQQYLDETGNSSIKVDVTTKGLQTNYHWRCSVDTLSASQTQNNLRSIINTIGMESLPLQLAQFIASAHHWSELNRLGKLAQSEVVACLLDDTVLECLFCTTLYVVQSREQTRTNFFFPPSSLLGLVRCSEFKIGNTYTVTFLPGNDGGVDIEVRVCSPLVRANDRDAKRRLLQLACTANSLLMERIRTYSELRKEVGMTMDHTPTNTYITMKYTQEFSAETTIDKIFTSISSLDEESMGKIKNVSNLACFLMGRQPAFYSITTVEAVAEYGGEGLATLDDLLESTSSDEAEAKDFDPSSVEFDFS